MRIPWPRFSSRTSASSSPATSRRPQAAVTSLLVDGTTIAALDPPPTPRPTPCSTPAAARCMPGLVDGHVHPVFGEWTPTQDTIGWIGNYVHGGTTTMISACELHVPGLDYENLTPDLVTSLAVVTAATTGRVRWSGARVHAGTVILVPGHDRGAFRPARRGEIDLRQVHLLSARHATRTRRCATRSGAAPAASAPRCTPAACRARGSARCAATTCCRGSSRTSPPMSAAGRSR